MMIFKKALARRTFLRGLGATVALPLLDAMVPAFAAPVANPASKAPTRFGVVYFPNGAIPGQWKVKGEGAAFELSPILEPLAPFRDSLLVLNGLNNREALGIPGESGGEHPRASAAFLTCVHPVVRSVGGRFTPRVGVSVDQLMADELDKHTELSVARVGHRVRRHRRLLRRR